MNKEYERKKVSNAAWDKANTREYKLQLMGTTEADMIEFLNGIDNINGYIKGLMRDDIKNKKKANAIQKD